MAVVRLHGVVKEYDWGRKDTIPSLLGVEADGKPKAEYWMGTHPSGPARLDDGSLFSEVLAEDPEGWFGGEHIARFGAKLPLLYKVLAISKPLSIQCHPTTAQAEAGWAKEAPLRAKDPDRSHWDYQDPNRKAEVLYALSPVTAMCGFRPFDDIARDLRTLVPHAWASFLHPEGSGDRALAALFRRLYLLDRADLASCTAELVASLRAQDGPLADGPFLTPRGIVLEAAESYPVDPGLFCPYLLHVLHLEPGQAVFLKPDTLHAYTRGVGLELMSASDNVLRGGLTHKKVDVPELLSLLSITGGEQALCGQRKLADGRIRILTPTEEFALYRFPEGSHRVVQPAIELFFQTEGSSELSTATERIHIAKGECWAKSADAGAYDVQVAGNLFSATTGV